MKKFIGGCEWKKNTNPTIVQKERCKAKEILVGCKRKETYEKKKNNGKVHHKLIRFHRFV
jgi:hypothetical protein